MPIESDPSERADGPAETATGVSPYEELPGLATAFDEKAMRGHLQAALFGGARARYTVERCPPTRPLYVPGAYCLVRYVLQARNAADGSLLEPMVTGRVFPSRAACLAYMNEKLAPLADRMRGRSEVEQLEAPAAVIEELGMVVHVWPIDGELPSLVEATDPGRMTDVFRELLAPLAVEECRIELVSYRRRQRCVLRYTLSAGALGESLPLVVYGKVTGVGNETLASPLIEALRTEVAERHRFTVPRLLAWRADLRLALLEELPGEARIRPAVRARLRGRPAPAGLPVEEMVTTCAHAAAALHASGIELGPLRTLADELATLGRETASVRRFAPQVGARADEWLARIAELGLASDPLELGLAHGDFNHAQLLFGDEGAALVDLDTICRAEPALDLGKFVAHLRAETEKLRRRAAVSSTLGDELAERFLHAYADANGASPAHERLLWERTALYEALSLVRLAVRSQHDFEEVRFDIATGLLEERLAAAAHNVSRP